MSKIQEMISAAGEKYRQIQPGLQKTRDITGLVFKWAWRLRRFVFAIPIVWLMIYLARLNNSMLPEMVGIGLLSTGEYARMIPRETAVYGPMAVTSACLLMMFLSRKTLYPWLISMFSMLLPLLILVTNLLVG